MRRLIVETLCIGVAAIAAVAAVLGLLPGEGSWLSRTADLLSRTITLDLESTLARAPVLSATASAAALSLAIVVTTTLMLLLIGVPLGIASATHAHSRRLRVIRGVLGAASSLPVLLWSTVIFVAVIRSLGIELSGDVNVVGATSGAVFALVLGDRVLADIVQRVEFRTSEVLAEPYMRTVRASRLGFKRHLLQSLVPSIADTVASRAMFLVSGAIVTERVFSIRGLGYWVTTALERAEREPQFVLALSVALVLIGLTFRLVTRAAARLADPRVVG